MTVSPTAARTVASEVTVPSRRRNCHLAAPPIVIPIETPTEGKGECSRMPVPPTARLCRSNGRRKPSSGAGPDQAPNGTCMKHR